MGEITKYHNFSFFLCKGKKGRYISIKDNKPKKKGSRDELGTNEGVVCIRSSEHKRQKEKKPRFFLFEG